MDKRIKRKPVVRGHPLVRELYAIMDAQHCTDKEMEKRSGLNIHTFQRWRTTSIPNVANFEACLNALGFELVIREKGE